MILVLPAPGDPRVHAGDLRANGIHLQFIPYLIQQHAEGKLPLEEIITRYKMAEYARAIQDVESGKTVKAVLTWE